MIPSLSSLHMDAEVRLVVKVIPQDWIDILHPMLHRKYLKTVTNHHKNLCIPGSMLARPASKNINGRI